MASWGAFAPSCGRVFILVHPRFAKKALEIACGLRVTASIGNGGIKSALDALGVVVSVPCRQLGDGLEHDRQTHSVASDGVRGRDKVGDGRMPKLVIEDIARQVGRAPVFRWQFPHKGIEHTAEK